MLVTPSGPVRTFAVVSVLDLSLEAKAVVTREREAVAGRVNDLKRQSAAVHDLVDGVDKELAGATGLLRQIDEMLGLAPQVPMETLVDELKGQRLREAAVQILRQRCGVGEAIHYMEWFALLEEAGIRIGGKNAVATFLTQLSEAPQVESVRPRSGLYRLKSA